MTIDESGVHLPSHRPTDRPPDCPTHDEPYQGYAAVYDALGQCQWGVALARFILDVVLPEQGVVPRNALDLACGTGAAALELAGAGLRTVGLDRSAAMLRAARRKAAIAGVRLSLVRGDLRAFAFIKPFDLVSCCYDSLNYLTEPRELGAAMASVREALASSGLFICDLTTPQAYISELDGIVQEFELSDLEYHWQTTWNQSSNLASTMLSVRTAKYGRCSERHVQRPYSPAEVSNSLHEAGLHLLATYGADVNGLPLSTPPEPNASRVIYVATRTS